MISTNIAGENLNLDERIANIKLVKNEIIGSHHLKKQYFNNGTLYEVLDVIQDADDENLIFQCLAVIGSFMNECSEAIEFLKSYPDLFAHFLHIFEKYRHNRRIVDVALRTLQVGIKYEALSIMELLQSDLFDFFPEIMISDVFVQIIADIISLCGTNTFHRRKIFEHKEVLKQLIDFVDITKSFKCQIAILDALSKVTTEYEELCRNLLEKRTIFDTLGKFTRHPSEKVRLIVAQLLTNLHNFHKFPTTQWHLLKWMIPSLAKTFIGGDEQTQIQINKILTNLMTENSDFQQIAGEIGFIEALSKVVTKIETATVDNPPSSPVENPPADSPPEEEKKAKTPSKKSKKSKKLEEENQPLLFDEKELTKENLLLQSSLLTLATICCTQEMCRILLVDTKCIPSIIKLLENKEGMIRGAACLCVKSLSRSDKLRKSALLNFGLKDKLFKLLSDEYLEVQTNATMTLCNMAIDFQQVLTENGGPIIRLVKLTYSKHSSLRKGAICALKNFLFMATLELKRKILKELTYQHLFELLDDQEINIQEQILSIFRNLLYKSSEDVIEVLNGCEGLGFINTVVDKLDSGYPPIMIQAAYILTNIAGGNERHKDLVCIPTILEKGHKNREIGQGAISLIANLAEKGEVGREKRLVVLNKVGAKEKLKELLLNDTGMDDSLKQTTNRTISSFE